MAPLSADVELHHLATESSKALERTIVALIRAKLEREDEAEEHKKLRRMLSQTLALASLLGRRRTLLQARAKGRGADFSAAAARADLDEAYLAASGLWGMPNRFHGGLRDIISPFVPKVTFDEAINDLLTRYPTLARGYKRVQQEYARGHAFALAKSTDAVVTRKVQKVVTDAIKAGSGLFKTSKVIASMGDWTKGYADTVYRTNASTAYMAGVVSQSMDPDVMEVCPAMELIGRTVEPSRDNHIACVGLIAGTKDPIWDRYAPPLGYNCTHGVNQVDRWELKERGLLMKDGTVRVYRPPNFANGGPDQGFDRGTSLARRLAM